MDNSALTSPIRPSPWPRIIVSVFILLAIGNAVILYLALSTKVAPLDEQPYEAGLRYETTIVEREAAKHDGVTATFEGSTNGMVAVVSGLPGDMRWQAEIELARPNDATLDRQGSIVAAGPRFEFPLQPMPRGLWLVRLRMTSGSKKYYFEDRVIL